MMINHWLRTLLCTAVFAVDIAVSAQTPLCKDTLEHRRLQSAMWESAKGHDADSVYEAIRAFQKHVDVEKDFEGHYSAWMCGVSYNLDRMNICDAYHIAVTLKDDLKNGMAAERLGGSLRLDHTSEAGTSFTLGLPLKIKSS